jgi:hypothetical protein
MWAVRSTFSWDDAQNGEGNKETDEATAVFLRNWRLFMVILSVYL